MMKVLVLAVAIFALLCAVLFQSGEPDFKKIKSIFSSTSANCFEMRGSYNNN